MLFFSLKAIFHLKAKRLITAVKGRFRNIRLVSNVKAIVEANAETNARANPKANPKANLKANLKEAIHECASRKATESKETCIGNHIFLSLSFRRKVWTLNLGLQDF